MKNYINGNKIGTRVNVSINGELHSKDCGTDEGAVEFFKRVLEVKSDPTDQNVESLYEYIHKNIRIARSQGFEYDIKTGEIFMVGFNTPVPELLVETIENYVENKFDTTAITNFWKLLMANPDKRVREDLFKFIGKHDFSLTDKGYMIVYKTVDYMNMVTQDLASFVSNAYLKVRKDWNTSPKKYVVYKEFTDDSFENFELKTTKSVTFDKWDVKAKKVELVGNLSNLQNNLDDLIDGEKSTVFTDLHTHKMEIRLGEPVKMDRKECDSDPKNDCSYGLHVGATKYVQNFARSSSVVLVCLVNPMHVVAVPEYDHSKMRVSEYFPFALATFEDRKIDIIEQKFFEYDYIAHEESDLAEMLRMSQDEDFRINSYNAPSDDRSMDDYLSILESRVIDLSNKYHD